jgi:cyclic pyranopterin monophosphate synthase
LRRVKLYSFDGVDASLDLLPLSARRALDVAGLKLSLEAWRALPLESRRALAEAGAASGVDAERVASLLPADQVSRLEPLSEPGATVIPAELSAAFGATRPISKALWQALSPLDRYALFKVASRGNPERVKAAYAEIVGHSALSTHLGPTGGARMVDVAQKVASLRQAVAETRVTMSADAFARVKNATVPKGDVLGTARLAGIMAAKRTSELIPLCHPLSLTKVELALDLDDAQSAISVRATVEAFDRTGVEMEALTAVSVAALTVYDMLKGIDRAMEMGPTRLIAKSGGRTGDFTRFVIPDGETR